MAGSPPAPSVGSMSLTQFNLTLSTTTYKVGDVFTTEIDIANIFRQTDGLAIIQSVCALDQADQLIGFDLYFMNDNFSLGARNTGPTISDANAKCIMARVPILQSDWYDDGDNKHAQVTGDRLGQVIRAKAGTRDLRIGAIVTSVGSATFNPSAMWITLGLVQN